jgi:hypothetical protein
VVWVSAKRTLHARTRPLKTLTDPDSGWPLAFTPDTLARSSFFASRPRATRGTLMDLLMGSSEQLPVLVPTDLAKSELGWPIVRMYVPPLPTPEEAS